MKELQAGGPSSKADAPSSKAAQQSSESDAAAMKKKGAFPATTWSPCSIMLLGHR